MCTLRNFTVTTPPIAPRYDIEALGRGRSMEKADGIAESRTRIIGLIDAEKAAGVPASRIVLAGFSQGGALALFTGLHYPETLAGILVMSGYLPVPKELAPSAAGVLSPVQVRARVNCGVPAASCSSV
jgi:predicted esterase